MGRAHLELAVDRFAGVFSGDYSLLQSIAHGHDVIQKPINISPAVDDAYELRVLSGTDAEIAWLVSASILNILCPDRRQAAKVARQLRQHRAIWLSPAGGGAQPDDNRLDALTDVVAYAMEENPSLETDITGHTGGCGGVKHALKDNFYKFMFRGDKTTDGYDGPWEQDAMKGIINYLPDSLIFSRSVDSSRIGVALAHVNSQDEFIGLERIR